LLLAFFHFPLQPRLIGGDDPLFSSTSVDCISSGFSKGLAAGPRVLYPRINAPG
jgi:hypothetical protein